MKTFDLCPILELLEERHVVIAGYTWHQVDALNLEGTLVRVDTRGSSNNSNGSSSNSNFKYIHTHQIIKHTAMHAFETLVDGVVGRLVHQAELILRLRSLRFATTKLTCAFDKLIC